MSTSLELPERFAWLKPRITAAVLKLAEERLLGGKCLIEKRKPTNPKYTKEQVKLALLIVQHTNPYEDFGDEEEALIRGMGYETLIGRRKDNLITRPL